MVGAARPRCFGGHPPGTKLVLAIVICLALTRPSGAELWCQWPGSPLHLELYDGGFMLMQSEPYHRRFEVTCDWVDRNRLLARCERIRGPGTMGPEGRPDYDPADDPPVEYEWQLSRFEVSADSAVIEWEDGPGPLTFFAQCE